MDEPSVFAASAVIFTVLFKFPFSSATSAVMIFVVLATSILESSFRAYSTRPESTSISTAAVAEVLTAWAWQGKILYNTKTVQNSVTNLLKRVSIYDHLSTEVTLVYPC
ncbi:hypothetical protein SDC9_204697 [bioreactor metagenome]|uniref:Uncharacterized protein n=1 Tax=bioreactor metagenome TaxID=1076179 RepID=A0A645JBT9_9ZZZZ